MASYLAHCRTCGRKTNKAYAKKHAGQCKACADPANYQPRPSSAAERDNANLIDAGYQAYARERGDYDLPDNY